MPISRMSSKRWLAFAFLAGLLCAHKPAGALSPAPEEPAAPAAAPTAPAATAPTDGEADWQIARRKIEEMVNVQLESALRKAINPQELAAKLGLEWPVLAPAMTPQEIQYKVEKDVKKDVDKKYPPSLLEDYQKEAEEKYRLFKQGEQVSLTIRGGIGTNANVTGRLLSVPGDRITISSRTIRREDLKEEDQARFYPEVSQRYIERYVRGKTGHYNMGREEMTKTLRDDYTNKAYLASGYLLRGNAWVPKDALFKHALRQTLEAERKRLREPIERELFIANDFVFDQEKREWLPKGFAEKMKEKLFGKKAEEEKKPAAAAEDEEEWEDEEEEAPKPDAKGAPAAAPKDEAKPEAKPKAKSNDIFDEAQ